MPTQEEIDIYEELRPKSNQLETQLKHCHQKNQMKLLICSRFGASTFLYLRQTPYLRILNRTMISTLSQRMTCHQIVMCF